MPVAVMVGVLILRSSWGLESVQYGQPVGGWLVSLRLCAGGGNAAAGGAGARLVQSDGGREPTVSTALIALKKQFVLDLGAD